MEYCDLQDFNVFRTYILMKFQTYVVSKQKQSRLLIKIYCAIWSYLLIYNVLITHSGLLNQATK